MWERVVFYDSFASHLFGKIHHPGSGSAKIRGSWKFLRYENEEMNYGHTENYILNHRIVCSHMRYVSASV